MAAGKIIKNKTNYLDFLKGLSSYLSNPTNNQNQISNLLTKHKVSKRELFKRLISYYYHSPHIIDYINKYMNNKFDFYKFDEIELIHSIKFISHQNNIKQFYFLKSSDLKDNNKPIIKKLLKEYFNTIKNLYINDLELNILYQLHKSNIEYFNSLNMLINGENSKLKLEYIYQETTSNKSQEDINEKVQKQIETQLSNEIAKYNLALINHKNNNKICKSCPLFNNKMISIDTNVSQPEKVDMMFILLNPGYNEGLYNRLLVGKAGKLFRSHLVQFDKNIKYVITNVIMCNTRKQADIGKTDKKIKSVIKNCSDYLKKVMNDFPAKVYIPIGKQAMEVFNVSGSITQNSGKVLNQNIIPLIHPSSVLQNESNRSIFEKSFDTINIIAHKIIQSKKGVQLINCKPEKPKKDILSKIPKVNDPSVKYNIPFENIINEPDASLTYLDSITLDYDNIVHIYLDADGTKKYIFNKIRIPVYIKNSEFNDRDLLTNKVDNVFYINKNQKYNLTKALMDNLIKCSC